jgi:hypothetical protein
MLAVEGCMVALYWLAGKGEVYAFEFGLVDMGASSACFKLEPNHLRLQRFFGGSPELDRGSA